MLRCHPDRPRPHAHAPWPPPTPRATWATHTGPFTSRSSSSRPRSFLVSDSSPSGVEQRNHNRTPRTGCRGRGIACTLSSRHWGSIEPLPAVGVQGILPCIPSSINVNVLLAYKWPPARGGKWRYSDRPCVKFSGERPAGGENRRTPGECLPAGSESSPYILLETFPRSALTPSSGSISPSSWAARLTFPLHDPTYFSSFPPSHAGSSSWAPRLRPKFRFFSSAKRRFLPPCRRDQTHSTVASLRKNQLCVRNDASGNSQDRNFAPAVGGQFAAMR